METIMPGIQKSYWMQTPGDAKLPPNVREVKGEGRGKFGTEKRVGGDIGRLRHPGWLGAHTFITNYHHLIQDYSLHPDELLYSRTQKEPTFQEDYPLRYEPQYLDIKYLSIMNPSVFGEACCVTQPMLKLGWPSTTQRQLVNLAQRDDEDQSANTYLTTAQMSEGELQQQLFERATAYYIDRGELEDGLANLILFKKFIPHQVVQREHNFKLINLPIPIHTIRNCRDHFQKKSETTLENLIWYSQLQQDHDYQNLD